MVEASLTAETTMELRPAEVLYLQPARLQAILAPSDRTARDLTTLLRVSTIITTIHGVEPLARRLLELIFEVIPAERGGILLARGETPDFDSVLASARDGVPRTALQVSRTVVERVLRERVAIWSNRVFEDETWARAQSLISARVRSVLCVPLALYEQVTGVVYVDASDPEWTFDESHLRLLTAIAAIAAPSLKNAREVEWLTRENQRLAAEADIERDMVGESPAMQGIYGLVGRVARTDSTVLICGESGTGKELVARAIHINSPRASKPFVAINCAAIAESILESELFGHEKGAFTGAIARKLGKFELADEGTVLLDEISEMPLSLQPKLLRVLQERELERVGGTRPVRVDIRVVAATNRDLQEAVRTGSFRQDLYYRLNVVTFTIPPLRDRRDDIPLLAAHFCDTYARKFNRRVSGVSPEAAECLMKYDWPGNVRELQNAIERAVVLGRDDVVRLEDLPDSVTEVRATGEPGEPGATEPAGYYEAVNEAKRKIALRALEQARGVVTEAAKLLGLSPNYLHRLLKNLGVK